MTLRQLVHEEGGVATYRLGWFHRISYAAVSTSSSCAQGSNTNMESSQTCLSSGPHASNWGMGPFVFPACDLLKDRLGCGSDTMKAEMPTAVTGGSSRFWRRGQQPDIVIDPHQCFSQKTKMTTGRCSSTTNQAPVRSQTCGASAVQH